jgi:hypothetical protein
MEASPAGGRNAPGGTLVVTGLAASALAPTAHGGRPTVRDPGHRPAQLATVTPTGHGPRKNRAILRRSGEAANVELGDTRSGLFPSPALVIV